MNNRKTISALLKLYPASWRKKYGPELADLLGKEALTAAIVCNVLWAALLQHVRTPPTWMRVSLLFMVWFLAGFVTNSLCAMSAGVYGVFWLTYLPLMVTTGFWLKRKGSRFPGLGTGCAVLCSSLPMTTIELLRARNILNPTIVDTRGHIWRAGVGFTEFAYRGEFAGPAHQFMSAYWIVTFGGVILALTTGFVGGKLAELAERFSRMTTAE